jgi:hypothetical protein
MTAGVLNAYLGIALALDVQVRARYLAQQLGRCTTCLPDKHQKRNAPAHLVDKMRGHKTQLPHSHTHQDADLQRGAEREKERQQPDSRVQLLDRIDTRQIADVVEGEKL